jgi:hypothetical protein
MVSATSPAANLPVPVPETVDVKALHNRVAVLEEEVSSLKRYVEKLEIQAAIRQGEEEADRGLGTPAEEVVARLRKKHGIGQQ